MILFLVEYDEYHDSQSVPSWRVAGDRSTGGNGDRGGDRRNGDGLAISCQKHGGVGKTIEGNGEDFQSDRLRQHSASRVQWR